MKCSRCQHENPTALKFCGECGTKLSPDIARARLLYCETDMRFWLEQAEAELKAF